jgi:hypothetical protein
MCALRQIGGQDKMSVTIELSSILSQYAENQSSFTVEGKTIGDCMHTALKKYPELGNVMLDQNGEIFPTYEIFLNGANSYPDTMSRPVKSGDKINIVLILLGG